MTPLLRSLRDITRALDEIAVPWALVGGLAVSARAEPRMTRDVDVAVAVPDDASAEQLVLNLRRRGYIPGTIIEQSAVGRLATVRFRRGDTDSGVLVDVLLASSGIEAEVAAQSERIGIAPRLKMPVARIGHLVALKLLARDDLHRPQDASDLVALRRVASPDELALAQQAVALIVTRGFHRKRDLASALSTWWGPT